MGDRIAKELVLAYCVAAAGLLVSLLVLSVPMLRLKPATARCLDSASAQAPAYVRLDDYLAAHPGADREAHERIARQEQEKEDAMVETVRRLPLLDAVFTYEHHRRYVVRGRHAGVRHYSLRTAGRPWRRARPGSGDAPRPPWLLERELLGGIPTRRVRGDVVMDSPAHVVHVALDVSARNRCVACKTRPSRDTSRS